MIPDMGNDRIDTDATIPFEDVLINITPFFIDDEKKKSKICVIILI